MTCFFLNIKSFSYNNMDDDFFTDQAETIAISGSTPQNQQTNAYNEEPPEDQFQFQSSNTYVPPTAENNWSVQPQQEDQITRKIREEEDKVLEKLRDKANKEYEEKLKRKEEGRKQLEDFLEAKEKQKQLRKKQNIEKQATLKEQREKLNIDAGWKKVAMNVAMKQGEHPGKKDVNRMRESIMNKRNDECN